MPTLGYWKIRGLAQPIRYLLAYCGDEFEDKMYEQGDAPDFSRECWIKEKFTLGLDMPNLPYFIDGDIKITQSNAIARHIARKHDLCGKTEVEKVRVDMMENTAMDFRNGGVRLFYNPQFDSLKEDYLKDLPAKLKLYADFLGSRNFFAGDNVTFPDFHMYEVFKQHVMLEPSCLDAFPTLQAFCTRVEELPAIKAYRASPKYSPLPCNGRRAAWGGQLVN